MLVRSIIGNDGKPTQVFTNYVPFVGNPSRNFVLINSHVPRGQVTCEKKQKNKNNFFFLIPLAELMPTPMKASHCASQANLSHRNEMKRLY